jgi:hypothetical protein
MHADMGKKLPYLHLFNAVGVEFYYFIDFRGGIVSYLRASINDPLI